MNKKYGYFLFFLSGVVVSVALFFFFHKPVVKKEVQKVEGPVHRMTIFVHGTFCSQMGLLSYTEVVQGKVKGTLYKKMQKKMRKDPSYYTAQPIQQKGLVPVIPTFDIAAVDNKKYAAYPLVNAYQMITQELKRTGDYKNNEISYYYTFGWSGLISQYERRKEAIRFYNTLCQEVEIFKKRGIDPKITILTHSHGGNLCLNMAALGFLLNSEKLINGGVFTENHEANESLEKMAEILKALPTKENAFSLKGQRRFDYVPVSKDLVVDQLILLGTPVQPETSFFWTFPLFNTIYHIYSDADTVQEMDWVSTKKSSSDKRFTVKIPSEKLFQIRIMYNRDLSRAFVRAGAPLGTSTSITPSVSQTVPPVIAPEHVAESAEVKNDKNIEKPKGIGMLLGTLFSYAKIVAGSKINQDPEHKELWFIMWENDKNPSQDNANSQKIDILPTVIFVPCLLASINTYNEQNAQKLYDVDANFVVKPDYLNIQLVKHQDNTVKHCERVPWSIVEYIRQEVRKWRPERVSK